MKRILFLLLLLPFIGYSQVYQNNSLYGTQFIRGAFTTNLAVPFDTFQVPNLVLPNGMNARSLPHIAGKGDSLWRWSPQQVKWLLVEGGSGSDGNNYVDSIKFVDNLLLVYRHGLSFVYDSWDSTKYHSVGYYDGKYADINHGHIPADITGLANYILNSYHSGTGINVNNVTGVISWTGTASGITSLNGLTATDQTFATGTSGSDFNIASVGSAHTFNFPTASATNRGLLSSTDWSTFNNKVSSSRTLTINGVAHDLSADRSWTVTASEVDPTVDAIIKAMPISVDATTNKYYYWNNGSIGRKQILSSELSNDAGFITSASITNLYNSDGSLTGARNVTQGTNRLFFNGSGTSNTNANFNIVGSGSNGLALSVTSNGRGAQIEGSAAGHNALTVQGYGSGFSTEIRGVDGIPLYIWNQPVSTNTLVTTFQSSRFTSGTAANGIGQTWDINNGNSAGTGITMTQFAFKSTNATSGSETGQFIIRGRNNGAVLADQFTLYGNGQTQLNKYGAGTFTGTLSKLSGWDASGKFIEVDPSSLVTSETDPTVNSIIKNIPVSADATTNKYLNWNGSAYVRKQVDYSELSGTPPVAPDDLSWFNVAIDGGGDTTGVTDVSSIVNAAITAGRKTIYFQKGRYLVSSSIQLKDSVRIFGDGNNLSTLVLASDIPAITGSFSSGGKKSEIDNIGFEGTYSGGATPAQRGIYLDSIAGANIHNISGYNIGGFVVHLRNNGYCCATYTTTATRGNLISDSYFQDNYGGVKLDTLSEYNSVTENVMTGNQIGIYVAGGNNTVTSNSASANYYNMYLTGGSNNGHGSATGNLFNHGKTSNVFIDGVSLGFSFSNNMIYAGATQMSILNSDNINFQGGDIVGTGNLTVTNSTNVRFNEVNMRTAPTWVISGTPPTVIRTGKSQNAISFNDIVNSRQFDISHTNGIVGMKSARILADTLHVTDRLSVGDSSLANIGTTKLYVAGQQKVVWNSNSAAINVTSNNNGLSNMQVENTSTLSSAGVGIVFKNNAGAVVQQWAGGTANGLVPDGFVIDGLRGGVTVLSRSGASTQFVDLSTGGFGTPSTRLRVFGSGRIGINTTTDDGYTRLQVAGTGKFTDTLTATTLANADSSDRMASTAWVKRQGFGSGGGFDPTAVHLSGTETITGTKTFNSNIYMNLTSVMAAGGYYTTNVGTMATPTGTDGQGVFYSKNDKLPYFKNADGTEMALYNNTSGFMANPMTTANDIIVGGSSGTPTRLAAGGEGSSLTVSGGNVTWQAGTNWNGAYASGSNGDLGGVTFGNTNSTLQVHNGGTGTATLPLASGGYTKVLHFINQGTGTLTIQRQGTDNIFYHGANVTSFPLQVGQSASVGLINSKWTVWFDAYDPNNLSNPMTATGDMIIGGSSGVPARLAAGTNGFMLQMVSGSPAWVNGATWNGLFTGGSISSSTTGSITIGTQYYIFTGSSAGNWDLPALSSSRIWYLKNAGSANWTITRAGSDVIWTDASVTSFTLTPGQSAAIVGGASSWYVFFQSSTGSGGANALGTYIVQTSTNAPANAQVLASLGTGLVKNTTSTGVLSIATASDIPDLSGTYLVKANNLSDVSNAGTARTNLGGTTVGQNFFTATNPSAITFPKIAADNSVSFESAATHRTSIGLGSVENTALSTWAGSSNITTVGTITSGTWSGTALVAGKLPAATVYNNQANTYTAGNKQTFQGDATNAGLNLAGITADPSGVANGDIWHNTTLNGLKYRSNGTTRIIANLDEAQTLTNKTISGASNTITNIANGSLTNSSVTIGSTSVSLGGTAATVSGLTLSGVTMSDATNIAINTTTGTKIGTATGQKIGFWNATPVVQQSGNVLTALSTTGIVTSPTLAAADISSGTFAAGRLATSGTADNTTYLGGDQTWHSAIQTRAFGMSAPTSSENAMMFFTPVAITVTNVQEALAGTSPSVTYVINYGSSRSSATSTIVASHAATSTTGTAASLNVTSIPANSYIWITTSATSGTVNDFNISLSYRQ